MVSLVELIKICHLIIGSLVGVCQVGGGLAASLCIDKCCWRLLLNLADRQSLFGSGGSARKSALELVGDDWHSLSIWWASFLGCTGLMRPPLMRAPLKLLKIGIIKAGGARTSESQQSQSER